MFPVDNNRKLALDEVFVPITFQELSDNSTTFSLIDSLEISESVFIVRLQRVINGNNENCSALGTLFVQAELLHF